MSPPASNSATASAVVVRAYTTRPVSPSDSLPLLVFVNLYYEFNNPGLVTSNLKCVVYSINHTAAEKTNLGGQQLAPLPAGLTYIQQSSGYSKKPMVTTTTTTATTTTATNTPSSGIKRRKPDPWLGR